ncbi:MAG: right-handed parallel beta-helix repeat-containing protein [Lentisphaerae bacterium]|nr:right-handed parallel beta-helix repeat-containing protein [Lentisphaerota bacterium]
MTKFTLLGGMLSGLCLSVALVSCQKTGGDVAGFGKDGDIRSVVPAAGLEKGRRTTPPGLHFFVSTEGNDDWTGLEPAWVKETPNGPFRTLAKAQAVVRGLPRLPGLPVTVHVRGGVYRLEDAWRFEPKDSGLADAPVVWQAYKDEKPVVSGARVIDQWTLAADGTWMAELPAVADGSWDVNQLFVNGQRRQRCRLPKKGFFRMAGPAVIWKNRDEANRNPRSKDSFLYNEGDVEAWDDIRNGVVWMYNSWTASIHHLAEITPAEKTLRLTKGMQWPIGHWDRKQRYHVENVRAALTDPGEWYMDYATGILSYLPMPGETPANCVVEAPVAQQLLVLQGDSEVGQFVENLVFSGIAFHHNAFVMPQDAMHDGQAAVGLTGAIYTNSARNCRFEDLNIAHTGTYGLWFAKGSQDNVLIRSELHDLGGGGVKIGESGGESNEATACRGNTVENCFIHDGGVIAQAGVGVLILRSSYNTLRHNEICDLYYSAVSVGWSWGYAPSSANHNVVEYNHLHHIGYGVLSDMGAIYTLGISPGTVLRGNHIHDIFSYSYGGWGLYTDEGSTEVLMEHNVVYNTKSGGFHQHYGRENIVRNNILAFSHEGQIIRSRQEAHSSFTVENNVVLFDNGRPYGGNWGNGNYLMRNNLYWDVTREPFEFSGYPLAEFQREEGQELGSVIAEPGFVNAAKFNFHLKEGAAAYPYVKDAVAAMDKAGLYGPSWWTRKPAQKQYKEVIPEMIPPKSERPRLGFLRELKLDFADVAVGEKSPVGSTSGEDEILGSSIRVSEEQPAPGGKRALKFVDADGLKFEWEPHLVYNFHWRKGVLTGAFAVFLKDDQAICWHEWRDSSAPYKVGPSIRFYGDGRLTVLDQELARFPKQTWLQVKIVCSVNPDAPATYDLEVTPAGGETKVFKGLEYGSKDWKELTWVGFVSEAKVRTEFFLGNVDFTRK